MGFKTSSRKSQVQASRVKLGMAKRSLAALQGCLASLVLIACPCGPQTVQRMGELGESLLPETVSKSLAGVRQGWTPWVGIEVPQSPMGCLPPRYAPGGANV